MNALHRIVLFLSFVALHALPAPALLPASLLPASNASSNVSGSGDVPDTFDDGPKGLHPGKHPDDVYDPGMYGPKGKHRGKHSDDAFDPDMYDPDKVSKKDLEKSAIDTKKNGGDLVSEVEAVTKKAGLDKKTSEAIAAACGSAAENADSTEEAQEIVAAEAYDLCVEDGQDDATSQLIANVCSECTAGELRARGKKEKGAHSAWFKAKKRALEARKHARKLRLKRKAK